MKKKLLIVCSALFSLSATVIAQGTEIKPRPATLQKILLESENFPKKNIVMNAYNSIPFPNQYVDFEFNNKSFNPKKYTITAADRVAAGGKSNSKLGSLSKKAAGNATGGLVDSTAADIPLQIEKYFVENQIAKKIAAKWLDIQGGIANLGNYMTTRALSGLSETEKKSIDMDTYKSSLLVQDVELMSNSFVIINKMFFQENEPAVRVIRDAAKIAATAKIKQPALLEKALKGLDDAYEKTKEGYTVFATSYLYQLDWNLEKATLAKEYFDNLKVNAKSVFDTTTLFKMKFLGKETSTALVGFSFKVKRTEEEIIKLAVKRAVNNSMAKLQRNFEEFRPIYRLSSTNPAAAEIGTKEGVNVGDKFDVLKPEQGKAAGTIVWKKSGSLKVDKKSIVWDNEDEFPKVDSTGKVIEVLKLTPLKGKVKQGCYNIRLAK